MRCKAGRSFHMVWSSVDSRADGAAGQPNTVRLATVDCRLATFDYQRRRKWLLGLATVNTDGVVYRRSMTGARASQSGVSAFPGRRRTVMARGGIPEMDGA